MGIHAHDPRTNEANGEVLKIIDLQSLVNQLPNHFCNLNSVTKSHVHARNAPERLKYQRKLVTLIQSGGLRTKGQELQSLRIKKRLEKRGTGGLVQPIAKISKEKRGASGDLALVWNL